jgi:hypothetical protein
MRNLTIACLAALLGAAGCSGPSAAPPPAPSAAVGGTGSAAAPLSSDDEPDHAEALAAARDGLRRFLDRIPEGTRASYGFSSPEEIDRAQLGAPYRVWTADPERTRAAPLSSVREWRFPVTVDGEYRALLTVSSANGGPLRAVALGAAGLARELGRHERDRAVPAQAERVLLRLYELRADFVAFPAAPPRSAGRPAGAVTAQQLESATFEALASARAHPRAPSGAVDLIASCPG